MKVIVVEPYAKELTDISWFNTLIRANLLQLNNIDHIWQQGAFRDINSCIKILDSHDLDTRLKVEKIMTLAAEPVKLRSFAHILKLLSDTKILKSLDYSQVFWARPADLHKFNQKLDVWKTNPLNDRTLLFIFSPTENAWKAYKRNYREKSVIHEAKIDANSPFVVELDKVRREGEECRGLNRRLLRDCALFEGDNVFDLLYENRDKGKGLEKAASALQQANLLNLSNFNTLITLDFSRLEVAAEAFSTLVKNTEAFNFNQRIFNVVLQLIEASLQAIPESLNTVEKNNIIKILQLIEHPFSYRLLGTIYSGEMWGWDNKYCNLEKAKGYLRSIPQETLWSRYALETLLNINMSMESNPEDNEKLAAELAATGHPLGEAYCRWGAANKGKRSLTHEQAIVALQKECEDYLNRLSNSKIDADKRKVIDGLQKTLATTNDSCDRIENFLKKINHRDTKDVLDNNDSFAIKFLKAVLVIISGIIPGLIVLAALSRYTSPKHSWAFWKSEHQLLQERVDRQLKIHSIVIEAERLSDSLPAVESSPITGLSLIKPEFGV
jgi:hypothetical protein